MKKCLLLLIVCFQCEVSFSQNSKIDSLTALLKTTKTDTAKVNTLNTLADEFKRNNPDTAIYFANEALALATKLNYKMGIADAYLCIGTAITNSGEYEVALKNINDALRLYNQLLKLDKTTDKSKILKQKAGAYNNSGIIYYEQGNYPEALKVRLAALNIREETKDKKGIAASYNNIGNIYTEQGNYPEALKNYFTSLKIKEEIGDKNGIAYSYNNIGAIYHYQGNYPDALKNHFAALKIREEIGNKQTIAASYINIGSIYDNQGNDHEALKYYFAALKFKEETGDKRGIAGSYNGIGNIYGDQEKYSLALKNYFAALKIQEEIGDKQGIASSYNNIGIIYKEQSNYSEALKNHLAALKISEEIGHKQGIDASYINIGNIYTKQKKSNEAYHYLNKGLSLAKVIGSLENIKESYSGLAKTDSAQGNFKQALEHYKMYITYRDSLLNEENTKKTVQSQMQYEFDKKEAATKAEQEKKDVLSRVEIQKQKTINNSIIGGTSVFVVSALFSFVFYRRRREAVMQNKITDSRLRAINAQMDDHFIFNCMQSIQSFIQKKDVQNADSYLVKFSKLLRKVLENSTQKEITLSDDLETLENYVELEKLRLDHPLRYNITIADDVNANEIFIPPLLIQPLIENAIEHGIKEKNEPGEISIDIRWSGKLLEIDITDNGAGIKEKPNNTGGRKSFGIPLTKERLEYLKSVNRIDALYKAENILDTEGNIKGTKVSLKIPISSAA